MDMLSSLALLLIQDSPLELIKKTRAFYAKQNSLQVTIVHDNTSGLFPGSYTQQLTYSKGNFNLVVTKPQGEINSEYGLVVPDFYKKGSEVTTVQKTGHTTDQFPPDQNSVPGWEVSGGLVLSFILETPSSKRIIDGPFPENYEFKWSFGDTTKFEGHQVYDIAVKIGRNDEVVESHFYIGTDQPLIYGMTSPKFNGKPSKLIYKDYVLNKELPDSIGTPPPTSK